VGVAEKWSLTKGVLADLWRIFQKGFLEKSGDEKP
jgi:hypothetical protein